MYDPLLNNVWIRGEISNLKKHSSGHIYFTLKDQLGAISVVMFRSHAYELIFDPEEGMEVLVQGYVSLYEKTGQYQFYAKDMEPDGKGALHKAYEQLKKKMELEGLFDPDTKQEIPRFPRKVGIITSGTGAAIRDIVNVAKRRNKTVELILQPVLVQGEGAPKEICRALHLFNEMIEPVDVIILGRGGGSIEDLWGFNDEKVARTIFASNIPVISAVGHETDFTIADFVSDLRAPTPSAAAELAIPSLEEFVKRVNDLKERLEGSIQRGVDKKRERLDWLMRSPAFMIPERYLDQQKQSLDQTSKRLQLAIDVCMKEKRLILKGLMDRLFLLGPEENLQRGYALVEDEVGGLVHSVDQVREGQKMKIRLKDGWIEVLVEKKESQHGQ